MMNPPTPVPPKPDLGQLSIPAARKRRAGLGLPARLGIVVGILVLALLAVVFSRSGGPRIVGTAGKTAPSVAATNSVPVLPSTEAVGDAVLTASGYIIARERIEISPRIQNTVKWIGVKKGDRVKKDQVIVLLDDSEHKARVAEAKAQVGVAKARAEAAQKQFARVQALQARAAESVQNLDEALRERDMAKAQWEVAEANLRLAEVSLDWCTVRSPIDGVVLEKLTEQGELVTPQTFGGTRGPSTALAAVADLNDLQVEIDVNEADVAKIRLGMKCRVTPEAWPDRHYDGVVAEMSPEASRQKGTLQVKVQVAKPDAFLTPELTAKVDFLRETADGRR